MNRNVGQASCLPPSATPTERTARAAALAGQAGSLPYTGPGAVPGPNACAKAKSGDRRLRRQAERYQFAPRRTVKLVGRELRVRFAHLASRRSASLS